MVDKYVGFGLVEASKLSLKDKFMQFEPETINQRTFHKSLVSVINSGIGDFYHPLFDPSFCDFEENKICFVPGKKPAIGKDYFFWKETAENYLPEYSRLAKEPEYIAFTGFMIKNLVASGWAIKTAWYMICNNSKGLGHYKTSLTSSFSFSNTGSKMICGFGDLGNTFKILDSDGLDGAICMASGAAHMTGSESPIASINHYDWETAKHYGSTGLIIIPVK